MYIYNVTLHVISDCDRGETVSLHLPMTPQQLESLKGHTDDPQALLVNIMTCDPEVLGELLDRQDDFPKTWNRPQELALTKLGRRISTLVATGEHLLPH